MLVADFLPGLTVGVFGVFGADEPREEISGGVILLERKGIRNYYSMFFFRNTNSFPVQ